MRRKRIVDTSFLSSLFVVDDVNHKQAERLYFDLKPGIALLAPRTVQIEILHLARIFGNVDALISFLRELKIQWIDIDREFMSRYEKFIESHKPKLKPMDSTVLYLACAMKAEILSFDKKLLRAVLKAS